MEIPLGASVVFWFTASISLRPGGHKSESVVSKSEQASDEDESDKQNPGWRRVFHRDSGPSLKKSKASQISRKVVVCPHAKAGASRGRTMFDRLVVSGATAAKTHRRWTVALSAAAQSVLLCVLILVPLIYTEALPSVMLKTMLVAPPPPPAPPVVVPRATRARIVPLTTITAPTHIPPKIATEVDEPPVFYVQGAQASGAESDALDDLLRPADPAKPLAVEQPAQRIPVGGAVEAALLTNRVVPQYPPIAITARVSGTVVLHAIIAKDGTVQELTYVSGPPLLIGAAMEAVRQWRYRPTLLNSMPVEVETTIEVIFNLGR